NPAAWYANKQFALATEWYADEFAYTSAIGGSGLLAETFLAIHLASETHGIYVHSFAKFNTVERVERLEFQEQNGKEHFMKKLLLYIVAIPLLFCGTLRITFVPAAAEQEKTLQAAESETSQTTSVPATEQQSAIDTQKTSETPKIAAKPEPKLKVSYPLIPREDISDFEKAVTVTLTDENGETTKIRLPNGSTVVRDHCFSPDEKYIYLTHQMSRYQMPTTQLERGWCQTNVISIIDAENKQYVNTVLLDDVDRGAANPWGCVVTQDGKYLCVALSGTNELMRIDLAAMHRKLNKQKPGKIPEERESGVYYADDVKNDLRFIETYMKLRVPLEANGPALPRKLELDENGLVIVRYHFVDDFVGVNFSKDEPEMVDFLYYRDADKYKDKVKLGEKYFNDATLCFQNWLSCASCHPDGRIDGLSWDLLNDGLGNPKKTRSLLGVKNRKTFYTENVPSLLSKTNKNLLENVIDYKFKYVMFCHKAKPDMIDAIAAYLRSLKPEPCPDQDHEKAIRGKIIFNQSLVGDTRPSCASCHSGPNFTDEQKHNVGTKAPYDRRDEFCTPPLFELWRHNAFLHSCKYETLESLLKYGEHGQQGSVRKLTDAEISDLCEYLKDTTFDVMTEPEEVFTSEKMEAGKNPQDEVYDVNKKVSDFPTDDFSSPENAYATIEQMQVEGKLNWSTASTKKLRELFSDTSPEAPLPKNKAQQVLDREILRVYRLGDYALVAAKVVSDDPEQTYYDLRHFEFEDGKWLNVGNDVLSDFDAIENKFKRAVSFREKEQLEAKRVTDLLKKYEDRITTYDVNKSVAEYPKESDHSSPELLTVFLNNALAKGDVEALNSVNPEKISGSEIDRIKNIPDEKEFADALLNAKILKVHIFDNRFAVVSTFLEGKNIRQPYDIKIMEYRNNTWQNLGNTRCNTELEAENLFALAIPDWVEKAPPVDAETKDNTKAEKEAALHAIKLDILKKRIKVSEMRYDRVKGMYDRGHKDGTYGNLCEATIALEDAKIAYYREIGDIKEWRSAVESKIEWCENNVKAVNMLYNNGSALLHNIGEADIKLLEAKEELAEVDILHDSEDQKQETGVTLTKAEKEAALQA
ncbi:MAG: hypothetical protein ACRC2T_04215, partial [Thermoguttaceae bacterium]